MDADTSPPAHRFSPGQMWTFHQDPGEPEATLTVLLVETTPQEVVHVSVSALRVNGTVSAVGHLPIAGDALRRSVVALVGTDDAPPDLGGYEHWRSAKGGVFTKRMSDVLRFVREAVERSNPSNSQGTP
jgi:hypothetical protein